MEYNFDLAFLDAIIEGNVKFIQIIIDNYYFLSSKLFCEGFVKCRHPEVYQQLINIALTRWPNGLYEVNQIIKNDIKSDDVNKVSMWYNAFIAKGVTNTIIQLCFESCKSASTLNIFLPLIQRKLPLMKYNDVVALFMESSISSTMYNLLYNYIKNTYDIMTIKSEVNHSNILYTQPKYFLLIEELVYVCIRESKPILLELILPDYINMGSTHNEIRDTLNNVKIKNAEIYALLHKYNVIDIKFHINRNKYNSGMDPLEIQNLKIELLSYGVNILDPPQYEYAKFSALYINDKITKIFTEMNIVTWDHLGLTPLICDYVVYNFDDPKS